MRMDEDQARGKSMVPDLLTEFDRERIERYCGLYGFTAVQARHA